MCNRDKLVVPVLTLAILLLFGFPTNQKPHWKGTITEAHGCIYTTEYEEDTGYARIKRYKIKNWDQIKEGGHE